MDDEEEKEKDRKERDEENGGRGGEVGQEGGDSSWTVGRTFIGRHSIHAGIISCRWVLYFGSPNNCNFEFRA